MSDQQILRDEVSFAHFINLLRKKKVLIFAIFLIWSAGAILFYWKSPVTFKANSVIRLGSFTKPVMTVPYAIQAMKEQKILSDAVTSGHISTDINTLKIMFESGAISAQNIPETQFIKITVKTSDYQSAKQICMAVSQAFVSYGKRIFAKRKEFIEQQIKELENKYQFYSRSLVTQPVTANIISLNEDLLNAEDFEVTDIPISNGVGERAVSERRLLFIILTGLIIAVLFAFIQDFMANLAYDYRKT